MVLDATTSQPNPLRLHLFNSHHFLCRQTRDSQLVIQAGCSPAGFSFQAFSHEPRGATQTAEPREQIQTLNPNHFRLAASYSCWICLSHSRAVTEIRALFPKPPWKFSPLAHHCYPFNPDPSQIPHIKREQHSLQGSDLLHSLCPWRCSPLCPQELSCTKGNPPEKLGEKQVNITWRKDW